VLGNLRSMFFGGNSAQRPTAALALRATAVLAAASAVAPAHAQNPYVEVDLDSFWDCAGVAVLSSLYLCIPAGGDRAHGPYFLQVKEPQSSPAKCCETAPYTIGTEVKFEVTGSIDLTICGTTKVGSPSARPSH